MRAFGFLLFVGGALGDWVTLALFGLGLAVLPGAFIDLALKLMTRYRDTRPLSKPRPVPARRIPKTHA